MLLGRAGTSARLPAETLPHPQGWAVGFFPWRFANPMLARVDDGLAMKADRAVYIRAWRSSTERAGAFGRFDMLSLESEARTS